MSEDVFLRLLIDRLGNAHRSIVDRYSLGHSVPSEIADTDADIAATLRDAATYLQQISRAPEPASAEKKQ